MKRLHQLSLIAVSFGLAACSPPPQQVIAPTPVVIAPTPLINVITEELIAATSATAQAPSILVPRFATEDELKAATTRQNSRPSARQRRAPMTAPPAPVQVTPEPSNSADPSSMIDVGELDALIAYLVENAGNYPPRFADRRERSLAEAETRQMIAALDPLVVQPNASFDLLIRAVKLNQVARNLDIGMQSAVKAGVYMRRAIALRPNDPMASYWFGTMLTEGGGIKEGIPHLNRAAQAGYKKAYLPLAQAYLHLDQRPNALSALESYGVAVPEQQAMTNLLIEQVKAGKNSIWAP